ncbi:DNA cytosine methyltransferase [Sulfurimonas sp. SAG-AH-194-C20]|nr:DNA cytosine methyltransferase [Sulfurimonas sp. SAG-AH-194-C20]MDF1879072.1 DNA cytosine methyltransferase [Sulfurimonas sp. SAG-AH-194-C20]
MLKVIDLFAGIGGIRLGFQEAFGNEIEFVFASEWDKFAQNTYSLNHNDTPHGDITTIKEGDIPNHNIILAGFPCQSFSIAGKRKGFEDTRGTLFFDVIRIAKYHKPKVIFLENVKGLIGHDKGNTFTVILETLEELGYKVFHKVLNSKDFGVPQNRERIYIVCFLDKNIEFEFPTCVQPVAKVQDFIKDRVPPKYEYIGKTIYPKLEFEVTKPNTFYQWRRKYVRENMGGVCPTLTANMGTGGHNVPIILSKQGIRKLTPMECVGLQGFPKSFTYPVGMSDAQKYKQIGNSVTVLVIKEIALDIRKSLLSK